MLVLTLQSEQKFGSILKAGLQFVPFAVLSSDRIPP